MYAGDYLNISVRLPEAKYMQTPLLQFEIMATCPVCRTTADIRHFSEIRPFLLTARGDVPRHQLSYDDETGEHNLLPLAAFKRNLINGLAHKRICESCGVSSEIPKVDMLRLRRQCEGYDLRSWIIEVVMVLQCAIKTRSERTPNDHYVDVPYYLAEHKAGTVIAFDASISA